MRKRTLALSVLLALSSGFLARGADEEEKKPGGKALQALKLRSIGPALMSGRIADIAVDPVKPNTWYVAVGSGNLWKTVNSGTTWTPIFEDYGSYSIGCVTLDPRDRHTVWVGTGENVGGRHAGYGDGVYLSRDGGASFKNMGLKRSEHISKIIVDPKNSNTVYVASQGPLWSSGGERGLYKSTDGGETWTAILTAGPWTGVTDLVMDPRNSKVLYAATHQRHRTVWGLVNGGPETAIYKTVDGGKSWTELKGGLPGGDKGKIGLAISPQKPDVVYAGIELSGRVGGVWRSADGGNSWTKMSDYVSGGTGPHYYQELYADPHRFDVLYHANVRLGRSEDGGKTWTTVGNRNKHVDNHAVAFHPSDPDFVLVGCDGGLYRSYDYAKTYQFCANLPLTQFYKVDVDYDEPFYHVVGGTQDNNSQYGPTRTRSNAGIRNSDWRITIGGDGHDNAIDPEDPDTIYSESQQGYIRRFDRRTGESVDIRPQPGPGEEDLRFNWDSPILISPHSHTRIYFGSKKLHRSDDRGDSWTTISPDLSRDIDRLTLPHMGRVPAVDGFYDLYAMSQYGNITSISESPLKEGLIYVGTDDGLIQVTEDGGKNWRRIDRVAGVPIGAFVNDVKADLHDVNTVYAVFDHHKTGDYSPYLAKSTDRGRSWTPFNGDLPERHLTWRIVQDHVKKDLFFLGTEFGLFTSWDGGEHWVKLPGAPNIPFRDLAIQTRENDLVGATFGRGFYVLDDYSPLRAMTEMAGEGFYLFPTRPAKLYIEDRVLGGPKGSQGDSFYRADNPPYGAVFTYHLKKGLESRKDRRQKREKKLAEAGRDSTHPGWDALRREDREEAPTLIFEIRTAKGERVRRITGPVSAGSHRIAWDLRYASFIGDNSAGPLVIPGTYTVQVFQRVDDVTTELSKPQSFEVRSILTPTLPRQKREEVLAFQKKAGALLRQTVNAAREIDEALEDLKKARGVIANSMDLDPALGDKARALALKLQDLKTELTGDQLKSRHSQPAPHGILRRIETALSGTMRQTYGPTKTHRQLYEIANTEFAALAKRLRPILDKEVAALLDGLKKAGAPRPPGNRGEDRNDEEEEG